MCILGMYVWIAQGISTSAGSQCACVIDRKNMVDKELDFLILDRKLQNSWD